RVYFRKQKRKTKTTSPTNQLFGLLIFLKHQHYSIVYVTFFPYMDHKSWLTLSLRENDVENISRVREMLLTSRHAWRMFTESGDPCYATKQAEFVPKKKKYKLKTNIQ